MTLTKAVSYARANYGRVLSESPQFLAFPSISSLAQHKGDVLNSAQWFGRLLRAIGVSTACAESGCASYERTVLRPALVVNPIGIQASPTGRESVIPAAGRAAAAPTGAGP